jgi:pimeloyl-ACP methyl ester carboxylesterase
MIMRFAALAAILLMACAGAHAADAPKAGAFKDRYIEANGLKFHYVSQGKGPMILFLHGFPASWFMWRDQLTEFGKDHMAVAPDTPGINLTEKPKDLEHYKLKYLVDDIHAFAAKVGGGKKFVLVAHDWGGVIAWVYAMTYPETLDKLVIINAPHPIIYEREARDNPVQRMESDYMFAFNNYDNYRADAWLLKNEDAVLQNITAGLVKSKSYSDADVGMWRAAWAVPGSVDAGLNYYRANHLNPPFNDHHPASTIKTSFVAKDVLDNVKSTTITTPTLVIWGLADTALQAGNLSGLATYVPNATYKFFPNDDHWVPMNEATEVNAAIRAFLNTPPTAP